MRMLIIILSVLGMSAVAVASDNQVEKVGIAECDDFLIKKFACFEWHEKNKGDSGDTMIPRAVHKMMAKRWKEDAKTNPAEVKMKCQKELEGVRQTPGLEACPHW